MSINPFETPLREQACHSCRYSRSLQGQNVVSCRRHSPLLQHPTFPPESGFTWGCWPVVVASSWCGEWVAADLDANK
jgi:hypothetical protein